MLFACCITKAINRHSEYVILTAFHGNNDYTNAPYCYVIPTFPAFFNAGMSRTEHRTSYGEKIRDKKNTLYNTYSFKSRRKNQQDATV